MSFRFHRSIPNLSIFHNVRSPHSERILHLLRSSLSSPYLPRAAAAARLEAEQSEYQLPQSYLNAHSSSILTYRPHLQRPTNILLCWTTSVHSPFLLHFQHLHDLSILGEEFRISWGVEELSALASKKPESVRWPVVVHWDDGLVAIEKEEDVHHILEVIYETANGGKGQQQDWLT
ncbi:hypothetical protein RHS01_08444 [Rhizoctonia solani]|uniref:Thioredoxin-like fold domain-containing protein n=1 Tax=Rhizoctonia solani TaxID=456999 RepID=A0A8H7I8S7_9AGAM|nr:hypothetical protein RHS01_08444 [Rhizoctonia solani]